MQFNEPHFVGYNLLISAQRRPTASLPSMYWRKEVFYASETCYLLRY